MNTHRHFKHDCEHCHFLGNVLAGGKEVDLYFCNQAGMPTVIARYSDEGSDYASGMPFGHPVDGSIAELMVARALAVRKGLLPE
jgi:hypothetical protein